MLLAERERLPVTVNFVRQNALRPAAIVVVIAVYSFPEVLRLVVRLKVQPLDTGVPIHQTDMQFHPELRVGTNFSSDDGTDPRLRQTDDAPRNAVALVFKHDTLLLINCGHQIQTFFLLFSQYNAILDKLDDVSHIPPDVL